jgi:hypothetical protein
MRFELTTLTLARLCSTPELRPHSVSRWRAAFGEASFTEASEGVQGEKS